jgi:hypothetical protein
MSRAGYRQGNLIDQNEGCNPTKAITFPWHHIRYNRNRARVVPLSDATEHNKGTAKVLGINIIRLAIMDFLTKVKSRPITV